MLHVRMQNVINDMVAVMYRLQSCCCVLCLDTMMLQVRLLHFTDMQYTNMLSLS